MLLNLLSATQGAWRSRHQSGLVAWKRETSARKGGTEQSWADLTARIYTALSVCSALFAVLPVGGPMEGWRQ